MSNVNIVLRIGILSIILALPLVLLGDALAAQPALEMPLNPAGQAYEINKDSQGFLWISDYLAGEIWQVDSRTGGYVVYPVGGGPSDARSDGSGYLWWVDAPSSQIGRLNTASGQASLWQIPGADSLYGTALGSAQDVWVTANYQPYLYHLNLAASEVCTYTLPVEASADYLLAVDGWIWLGDWVNGSILRLEVSPGSFTHWQISPDSRPTGIALDALGRVWWADTGLGVLASLDPASNQLVTYDQPALQSPLMIAVDGSRIWYTDNNTVGMLDPVRASGNAIFVTPVNQATQPVCAAIQPTSLATFTPGAGQAVLKSVSYTVLSSPPGWHDFILPEGASAWGIAVLDGIWVVDQGRQVLTRVSWQSESKLFLPLVVR